MDYKALVKGILALHRDLVGRAALAVNQALVVRNWMIGGYLVEFEQKGSDRAAYGQGLLRRLAADLGSRGIKGSSPDMLERMRLLFRYYPQLATDFSAPARNLARRKFRSDQASISAPPVRKSDADSPAPLPAAVLLRLSWTHLADLVRIDEPWKRAFYETECLKGNWSKRQLRRQIESLLFERTGLSTNKQAVIEAGRRQAHESPQSLADLIRDPYVLEFTGLAEKPHYRESDLESGLLDHLQNFLLELGTGFCFESRQRRVTIGNEHDYIDLVFYHRKLRCHVLIDLKVRAFRHADAGQMNFYLNYWKANELEDGDGPPVGLLLCSAKSTTRVEYATAGLDHQLFVSRYLVALPSADQLRNLVEADRAAIESAASESSASD
jgi:predicted nuclease of restriction endonuclease-like (RecB) superfamily